MTEADDTPIPVAVNPADVLAVLNERAKNDRLLAEVLESAMYQVGFLQMKRERDALLAAADESADTVEEGQ